MRGRGQPERPQARKARLPRPLAARRSGCERSARRPPAPSSRRTGAVACSNARWNVSGASSGPSTSCTGGEVRRAAAEGSGHEAGRARRMRPPRGRVQPSELGAIGQLERLRVAQHHADRDPHGPATAATNPSGGVSPPRSSARTSSSRPAPPCSASRASSTVSTMTSISTPAVYKTRGQVCVWPSPGQVSDPVPGGARAVGNFCDLAPKNAGLET